MKDKSKRKLIGLTIALSSVSVIALSPMIANQITVKKHQLNNANSLRVRSVANSGYMISSNSTAFIGDKDYEGKLNASTPNTFKSIPSGYVMPAIIGEENHLICVDKDNLNNILWSSNFELQKEIISIDYLPSTDSLVVLYYDYSKERASETVYIRIATFDNVSSIKDGSELDLNNKNSLVKKYKYSDSDKDDRSYNRPDTWSMSPIINEQGPSNEFIIYPKIQKAWRQEEVKWLKYNAIENKIEEIPSMETWNYINNDETPEAILSLGIIKKDDIYYANALVASQSKDDISKTVISSDWIKFNNEESFNLIKDESPRVYTINQDELISDLFNISNKNDLLKTIKSSISNPSIYYDGISVSFAHAVNIFGSTNDFSKSIHAKTFLAKSQLIFENESIELSAIPLFDKSLGENTQLWNGYFDNSSIMKYGALITSENGSTPFIGLGFKNNDSINNFFVNVIKDPLNSQYFDEEQYPDGLSISSDLNNDYNRIYMLSSLKDEYDKTDSPYYKYFDVNIDKGIGLEQQLAGIPIMEYNDSIDQLSNPFISNIFFSVNNSNEAIIINQENRGQNTQSAASYGWYTQFDKEVNVELGDINYSIGLVDIEYLNETYKFESSDWINSSLLSNNLGSKNVREDSMFVIDPTSIKRDYPNGSVTFDIYVTKFYNQNGNLIINDLEEIKNDFSIHEKISTITITGFKPEQKTAVRSNSIDLSNLTTKRNEKIIAAINITPSKVEKAINIDNQEKIQNWGNDDNQWELMDLIWQKITNHDDNENIFANLRHIPNYVQDWTWDDINEVLSSYQIVSFDNSIGSITVDLTLKDKYIGGSDDGDITYQVKFSGLRTIDQTKVVNNLELNIKDANFANQKNRSFSAIKEFASNDDNIKQFIIDNKQNIFNYLPDNFTKDNITSINRDINDKEQSIKITFTINKYFNSDGDVIDESTIVDQSVALYNENNKINEFSFVLNGFEKSEKINVGLIVGISILSFTIAAMIVAIVLVVLKDRKLNKQI